MKHNIYTARYKNALKKAAKINRLMKKGYVVLYDGSPKHQGFVLRDREILLKISDNSYYLFYEDSSEFDHGYYTKIEDWNKNFNERFEVYKPEARVKLI